MALGDTVEWFAATFPGAAPHETIDGVRIIRRGHQWSVHLSAFAWYRRTIRSDFDVVVDQTNTIPFFTPLWAGIPIVMFIHQLAREVWWYESRFPLSAIGFALEPWYLRLYRRTAIVTVSESTRGDLVRLRFRGPITVIPEGLEPIGAAAAGKPDTPTFLYVGRLAPSKRVADLIDALAIFNRSTTPGRLRLIGEGPSWYLRQLQSRADQLGVHEYVEFLGRLPADLKHSEMAGAHALVLASVREGWGLVVTEANAVGTPAIAYDVPGLRDSIRDGNTGLLVEPDPRSLAAAMWRVWTDRPLLHRLSQSARAWGTTFSFDASAARFREALVSAQSDRATRAAFTAAGREVHIHDPGTGE